MDDADRLVELTGFAARLTAAVGAAELGAATRFPDDAGFTIRFQADELWVAGRRLVSPTPAVVVDLATPLDAAVVCRAVGLQRPVGVSGDVHQHRWEVLVAGAPVPDPHAHRILVEPLRLGHWALRPLLAGRPAGALPQRVAGASPAYDVVAGSGSVVRLQVARREVWADILPAGHPHASVLLAGMARAAPSWRLGWDVSPEDPVVVVYDDDEPAAGAVLRLGEIAVASRLCAAPVSGEGDAGSSLLDVLEALALEHAAACCAWTAARSSPAPACLGHATATASDRTTRVTRTSRSGPNETCGRPGRQACREKSDCHPIPHRGQPPRLPPTERCQLLSRPAPTALPGARATQEPEDPDPR